MARNVFVSVTDGALSVRGDTVKPVEIEQLAPAGSKTHVRRISDEADAGFRVADHHQY
jgi:hypothetical protein